LIKVGKKQSKTGKPPIKKRIDTRQEALPAVLPVYVWDLFIKLWH